MTGQLVRQSCVVFLLIGRLWEAVITLRGAGIAFLGVLIIGSLGCGPEPKAIMPKSSEAVDVKLPEQKPKRVSAPPQNVKAEAVGGVRREPGPAGIGGTMLSTTVQDVRISWDAVEGADSYTIYWSKAPGVSKKAGTPMVNVVSPYLHTGLEEGQKYYYVVTASGPSGESPESQEVSAQPKSGELRFRLDGGVPVPRF